jgi:hypothetical protein
MNQVKMMGEIEITKEGFPLKKHEWRCEVCKEVYVMKYKAQQCNHKKYIQVYPYGMRWVDYTGKIEHLEGDIK